MKKRQLEKKRLALKKQATKKKLQAKIMKDTCPKTQIAPIPPLPALTIPYQESYRPRRRRDMGYRESRRMDRYDHGGFNANMNMNMGGMPYPPNYNAYNGNNEISFCSHTYAQNGTE